MTEQQKLLWGIGFLLAVSICLNVYFIGKEVPPELSGASTMNSSVVHDSPGFRSEVMTVFDGSRYRTYATSTPLSESDVVRMRDEMHRELDRMHEYFDRQEDLFRIFWRF